jgi:adenosine kinase
VRECREMGIPCLYDPSQQAARMDGTALREGIDAAELLFCNEYEYELIRKKTGLTPEDILAKVKVLVVTLGEKGAAITVGGKEIRVPVAPPDRIADPTGVGDAFRGGFLKGYAHALPLELCGKMGALAATYCLEKEGTQNHAYSRPEFGARYRKVFGAEPAVDKLLI